MLLSFNCIAIQNYISFRIKTCVKVPTMKGKCEYTFATRYQSCFLLTLTSMHYKHNLVSSNITSYISHKVMPTSFHFMAGATRNTLYTGPRLYRSWMRRARWTSTNSCCTKLTLLCTSSFYCWWSTSFWLWRCKHLTDTDSEGETSG